MRRYTRLILISWHISGYLQWWGESLGAPGSPCLTEMQQKKKKNMRSAMYLPLEVASIICSPLSLLLEAGFCCNPRESFNTEGDGCCCCCGSAAGLGFFMWRVGKENSVRIIFIFLHFPSFTPGLAAGKTIVLM